MSAALYVGYVMHRRVRPRPHRLRYRVFWLLFDLDSIAELDERLRLFSLGRLNLFSFNLADHGDGTATPLRTQVEQKLRSAGISLEGGRIELLCMPRILGYVFNPLSIYYCYASNGELAALIYQVHNTFGERHSYVLEAGCPENDVVSQQANKTFYVSPFLDMNMRYAFRARIPGEALSLSIMGSDPQGPLITAVMTGRRRALTDAALLRVFVTHPLLTLKVIGGIHFEAARLWLKGIRLVPRPGIREHAGRTLAPPGVQHD